MGLCAVAGGLAVRKLPGTVYTSDGMRDAEVGAGGAKFAMFLQQLALGLVVIRSRLADGVKGSIPVPNRTFYWPTRRSCILDL